ncbi:MAG TPA: hypothetical protein VFM21_03765, partial [Terriglobia bacterium]|nr:hypothetical protein [Terriglobia bacterium]
VSSPQRRSGISNFESGISSSQRGSGILNFESGIPVPWLVAIALVFLLGLSLAALACLRALAADREPRVANFSSRSPSREPLAPILRPRFPMRLSFAALLLFALISVSCGGRGNDTIIHNPGTPGGDYLLTITATTTSGSSTVTHTITLDLKVT